MKKKKFTISMLNKTEVLKKSAGMIFLLSCLISLATAQQYANKRLLLKEVNYNLDLRIDYENGKLISICELTVFNTSSEKTQIIPLLLYRLMKVSSIKDERGILYLIHKGSYRLKTGRNTR